MWMFGFFMFCQISWMFEKQRAGITKINVFWNNSMSGRFMPCQFKSIVRLLTTDFTILFQKYNQFVRL